MVFKFEIPQPIDILPGCNFQTLFTSVVDYGINPEGYSQVHLFKNLTSLY